MEFQQVENLKLSVTNIKSSLINSNKKLIKLNKQKITLFDRQEKKQNRKNKESNIETPLKSKFSGVIKSSKSIISKPMGFFDRILNFFGAILLGYAADNLPLIIQKVTEIYETTKPIWKGILATLRIVGKGIIFAFDALSSTFDPVKAETNLKDSENELKRLDKELDIEDINIVPEKPPSIGANLSGIEPSPPPSINLVGQNPTIQKSVYRPKIGGMNKGGVVQRNKSRPTKPSSSIAERNPVRLFPQASNSLAYGIKLYKKNVEMFGNTVDAISSSVSSTNNPFRRLSNNRGRISSLDIGSGGGLLSDMSDEDWKNLGFVVSGEAERGTDDEYGVAASVLNRVASTDWPNTIEGVISERGQYAAIKDGGAHHDPQLVEQLKSAEGQAKIIEALNILEGRTDFKGTTQYHNYVPGEDIKFSSRGNFYHYSWQTGRNSVKPVGFKDVNFQKFIKRSNIQELPEEMQVLIMPIIEKQEVPTPVPILLNNSNNNGTSHFTENLRKIQLYNNIP